MAARTCSCPTPRSSLAASSPPVVSFTDTGCSNPWKIEAGSGPSFTLASNRHARRRTRPEESTNRTASPVRHRQLLSAGGGGPLRVWFGPSASGGEASAARRPGSGLVPAVTTSATTTRAPITSVTMRTARDLLRRMGIPAATADTPCFPARHPSTDPAPASV